MSAPPKTVLTASPQEEAAIREAVRTVDPLTLGEGRVIAGAQHAPGLTRLLEDPAVSGPIYDLPRPITEANVAIWIAECARLADPRRQILAQGDAVSVQAQHKRCHQ